MDLSSHRVRLVFTLRNVYSKMLCCAIARCGEILNVGGQVNQITDIVVGYRLIDRSKFQLMSY